MSWMKTKKQLARRGTNSRERWASGRVAKTSWRKNKSGGDAELGRI
jgi:hypothetical protein